MSRAPCTTRRKRASSLDRIADPGTTRRRVYTRLIDEVVACGVWELLDFWYVLACDNPASSLINVVSRAFPLSVVSTPVFWTNGGWSGDNGNNGYLTTGYTPMASGKHWTRDNAHLAEWDLTEGDNQYLSITGDNAGCFIQPKGNGRVTAAINSPNYISFPIATSVGHSLVNRTSSAGVEIFKNGASLGSGAAASADGGSILLICRSADLNPSRTEICAFASGGASLSTDQQIAFYNAQLHYLLGIGVPNPI